MEGAGASNVSHAAETRGMDTADEEPELPSAVQDLIWRLEGEGEPVKALPHLFKGEFREFFPERASLSTITGWRSQVRLRVLDAIGSCNTLEFLQVGTMCGRDISRLTESEWEVVFRGFKSSTVLEWIALSELEWSSDAEVESLCSQIGRILNTSSVYKLQIAYTKLSARCWLNLASGLQGNPDSKLRELELYDAWEDASAVKHVADVIKSAPLLNMLGIGCKDDMEEEAVGILSQVLIQSSSLRILFLQKVKWGEALLLNALARDDGNRSISYLHLAEMDGLGGCLRELLTSNPSLKCVTLNNSRMSPEEWRQLGEFIRDSADILCTDIDVRFTKNNVRDEWESIEALATAASSDVKDPHILGLQLLELQQAGDNELRLSLNLLGRVLRGEIKSLKYFRILALNPGTSGTSQDRQESFLSMNGKTGETSVLKKLLVCVVNEDVWKGLWKDLLLCLRGNTSLTHLCLRPDNEGRERYSGKVSFRYLDEEAFKDLMALLQVNLTLQVIDVSNTSWATDGKEGLIQESLKQNQKRLAYMSLFIDAKLKFGEAKAGRLFLCGSPLAVSIPNLDYIIVDPNWLTNKLLGKLVALMSRDSSASKDGFVSEGVFAGLIEEFLGKVPHGRSCVDRDVLENILINLDLCFKVEDTSKYFIPSFIPEHASTEVLKPQELADVKSKDWALRVGTSKFVGIRIQCQDRRTMSLTAAFFPCFQMFMRRKLISEMHVDKETLTCSRHYMRLFLDGHEIYLEQGTSRNYVDVLMLCSDHKPREMAIEYVKKHIVQELISFCASSKGCPGVALVLGVIQTRCVEMLIPSHLRGAILIEELKSNFICYINDKLENIQSDRFHLEKEKELFNYEHSWRSIEGHTGVISERARDLLWESDLEAVVNEIKQKRMQQLESFQQGLDEVNRDLIHSYPKMKDSKRPSSRCLSQKSTGIEYREIQHALERIEKKVDGGFETLRLGLERLELKIEQILSLQQELQSTLSDFMTKVDRIIEYTQEFQQTRTPKRPYVTNDVNIFYRMSAKLHAGITVRLHLMCESATGFHLVKDQEGLKIRLDQENCGWIRKTIEISFKLTYYAAKAGLNATLGVGQAIPDWGDLKSDIVKLDGISDGDRRAVLKGGESMELKEAWPRIQQTLEPINYSAVFKLYQVKYARLELGGHAWVCEECMKKGRRSGILTN
ncbi:hypothetical protein AXG93_3228s1290 [Marchantia polymorpha subsp. ruderalis]|uniref:C-terminal of Roc (COR) domain-containing protein n=1 Tax=Marchantia polymorpha subsp. ruderalis TaxID=1480154 RepID=A0A176WJU6_MARPO|nr:hypothetical protein AXG93_3228s1290 [Marchantia polymorpha subsp. ruderalis]